VAVEHFQSVLAEDFGSIINRVHPKGVLVTGLIAGLSQRQKDSFNQYRHALHRLTVITFDELLTMLKLLYSDALPRIPAEPNDPWADESSYYGMDNSGSYSDEPPF